MCVLLALFGIACSGMHKADPQNPMPADPRHAASQIVVCPDESSYKIGRNECVGAKDKP